jgi:hypothetical protein
MNNEIVHVPVEPITPLTYLREILAMSSRHGSELALTVGGMVIIVLTSLTTFSVLHLQPFGNSMQLLGVLMSAVVAVMFLEAALAGWRLYRRQWIALASARSLIALNAGDRLRLERHLRALYRRREARVEERNVARIERLDGEIAALQTRMAGDFYGPPRNPMC